MTAPLCVVTTCFLHKKSILMLTSLSIKEVVSSGHDVKRFTVVDPSINFSDHLPLICRPNLLHHPDNTSDPYSAPQKRMKSLACSYAGTKRIVWPTTYTPVSIYNRLLMLFAICHMRIRRVLHPLTVYKFVLSQCIIQSCQFYVLLLTGLFLNARRGYSSSGGTKS